MSELYDLDKVARPDIRLRLEGTEYTVPGELGVEQMLRWIKLQERWADQVRRAQTLRERLDDGEDVPDSEADDLESSEDLLLESKSEIVALFRERDPKLEDLPLKSSQIGAVFAILFGRYEADEAGGDPPTQTPKRGRSRKSSKPSASSPAASRS